MSKFAALFGGNGLAVGGAVTAAAVAGGLYVSGVLTPPGPSDPDAADAPDEVALVAPETSAPDSSAPATPQAAPEPPDAVTDPAPDTPAESLDDPEARAAAPEPGDPAPRPDAQERAGPDATPPMAPPGFDLVRVAPDGQTLVAGQAAPGARVEVLVDAAVMAETTAGRDGTFAAFLSLAPSSAPRVMTLRMRTETDMVDGTDEVILAPAPPTQVAQGAPQPAAPPAAPAGTPPETRQPEAVTGIGPAAAPQPEPQTEQQTEPPAAEIETAAAPAPEPATTVLLSNEEGVRVLQRPDPAAETPPELLDNVAIDSISYDDSGEVEISGRGRSDSFVRVYLDNTPITTSRIAEDGNWRTGLPEIDTGVYTLRVDQIDAETGTVLSRAETPFKREERAVVADAGERLAAQVVTVQPGSTLWAIARDTYGEGTLYVRVFEANRDLIRDPDLIYPGQVFAVPGE